MAKETFSRVKTHVNIDFRPPVPPPPVSPGGGTVPVYKGQTIPYTLPGVTGVVEEVLEDDLAPVSLGISDDPSVVSVVTVEISYSNASPGNPDWTESPKGLGLGCVYLLTVAGSDRPAVLLADDGAGTWTMGLFQAGASLDGANISKVVALAPVHASGFLSFGGSVGVYRTGSPSAYDSALNLALAMNADSDYDFDGGFIQFSVSATDPSLGKVTESFNLGPFEDQDAVDAFFAELEASNGWRRISGNPEGRTHSSASILSRIRRLQKTITRNADRLSAITGGSLGASSTEEDIEAFAVATDSRNRNLLSINDRVSLNPVVLSRLVSGLYPSRTVLFPAVAGDNFDDFYELNRSLAPDRFFEDLRVANGSIEIPSIEFNVETSFGAHEVMFSTFTDSEGNPMQWRSVRIDVNDSGAIVLVSVSNNIEATAYEDNEALQLLLETVLPATRVGVRSYYYLFAYGNHEATMIPGAALLVTSEGFSVRSEYASSNWTQFLGGATF